MGPSFENFSEIVKAMREREAIQVISADGLAGALVEMLRGAKARAMGERGCEVFEAEAGATARTVAALMELLDSRGER